MASNIVVNLLAKTGTFDTNIRKSSKNLDVFGSTAKKVALGVAAAGVAAASGFAYMLKRQIDVMDNMSKAAQQAGTTTEALSALGYAAELSGASQDEMTAALVRLSRSMGDALSGSEKTADAFKAIGVSASSADGMMRSTDEVFADIADKFSKMEDGARKTALAQDLFGRSGATLIPLLNAGRGGLEEMRIEAEKLGIVIDTNAAMAAERFNDNLSRLSKIGVGLVNQFAIEMIPFLDEIASQMFNASVETDYLGEASGNLTKRPVNSWARGVTEALAGIADVAATVIKMFSGMGLAGEAFSTRIIASMSGVQRDMLNIFLDHPVLSLLPDSVERSLRMSVEEPYTEHLNRMYAADAALRKHLGSGDVGYVSSYYRDAYTASQSAPMAPVTRTGKWEPTRSKSDDAAAKKFLKEQEKAAKDYQKFINDITGRTDAARKAQEEAWVLHALTIGEITTTEFEEAMNTIADFANGTTYEVNEFVLEAARNIQNALGDGLYSILKGNFEDIGQSFGDMVLKMAADAAAANLAGALFGNYSQTGQIGGLFGQIGKAVMNLFPVAEGATATGTGTTAGGAGAVAFPVSPFASGGYTGPGGRNEPAGIVHRGEVVFSQRDVARAGGVSRVEAIRKRGYADGGVVGGMAAGTASAPVVNVTNRGTPQQVESAQATFDGSKWVLSVVMNDIRNNGALGQLMRRNGAMA